MKSKNKKKQRKQNRKNSDSDDTISSDCRNASLNTTPSSIHSCSISTSLPLELSSIEEEEPKRALPSDHSQCSQSCQQQYDAIIAHSHKDRAEAFAAKKWLENKVTLKTGAFQCSPKIELLGNIYSAYVSSLEMVHKYTKTIIVFCTKHFQKDLQFRRAVDALWVWQSVGEVQIVPLLVGFGPEESPPESIPLRDSHPIYYEPQSDYFRHCMACVLSRNLAQRLQSDASREECNRCRRQHDLPVTRLSGIPSKIVNSEESCGLDTCTTARQRTIGCPNSHTDPNNFFGDNGDYFNNNNDDNYTCDNNNDDNDNNDDDDDNGNISLHDDVTTQLISLPAEADCASNHQTSFSGPTGLHLCPSKMATYASSSSETKTLRIVSNEINTEESSEREPGNDTFRATVSQEYPDAGSTIYISAPTGESMARCNPAGRPTHVIQSEARGTRKTKPNNNAEDGEPIEKLKAGTSSSKQVYYQWGTNLTPSLPAKLPYLTKTFPDTYEMEQKQESHEEIGKATVLESMVKTDESKTTGVITFAQISCQPSTEAHKIDTCMPPKRTAILASPGESASVKGGPTEHSGLICKSAPVTGGATGQSDSLTRGDEKSSEDAETNDFLAGQLVVVEDDGFEHRSSVEKRTETTIKLRDAADQPGLYLSTLSSDAVFTDINYQTSLTSSAEGYLTPVFSPDETEQAAHRERWPIPENFIHELDEESEDRQRCICNKDLRKRFLVRNEPTLDLNFDPDDKHYDSRIVRLNNTRIKENGSLEMLNNLRSRATKSPPDNAYLNFGGFTETLKSTEKLSSLGSSRKVGLSTAGDTRSETDGNATREASRSCTFSGPETAKGVVNIHHADTVIVNAHHCSHSERFEPMTCASRSSGNGRSSQTTSLDDCPRPSNSRGAFSSMKSLWESGKSRHGIAIPDAPPLPCRCSNKTSKSMKVHQNDLPKQTIVKKRLRRRVSSRLRVLFCCGKVKEDKIEDSAMTYTDSNPYDVIPEIIEMRKSCKDSSQSQRSTRKSPKEITMTK